MKAFNLCMVLWLAGVLFMSFNCVSNNVNRSILVSGMITTVDANAMSSRNPKENGYNTKFGKGSYYNGDASTVEDYGAVDPPPSSKASVRHGSIQHGTPSMPHIPDMNPSPPTPAGPFGHDGLTT